MRELYRVHVLRAVTQPKPRRSAKVVVLEARRQARLERRNLERRSPRPAA